MREELREILLTLRQHKIRTLLTAFGVFWGIFMLVLLLGAGHGMENGVKAEFGADVLNFLVVSPGVTSVPYQGLGIGRQIRFDQTDVQAISTNVRSVSIATMDRTAGRGMISNGGKNGSFEIHGVSDDFFKIKSDVPFDFGRKLDLLDAINTRKVVIIGTHVMERLFSDNVNPVGMDIRVNGLIMKVVGVFFDKFGREQFSDRVYIPDTTFERIFGPVHSSMQIWVRLVNAENIEESEKKILHLIKNRHNVADEDRRGITSFNIAREAKRTDDLFSGIDALLWFVGLGTLTGGAVGVGNVMIIAVRERTKEIGLRKALGATPLGIVSSILLESVLLTTLSGCLGLAFGVFVLEFTSMFLKKSDMEVPYFDHPSIDLNIVVLASISLTAVGVIAAVVPALRAANVCPTDAMRSD